MLTVAEIMTPNPITIRRDTPLSAVIGLMKSHRCRQLPVVDEGRLVGIVTDRDIRLAMNSPLILHDRSDDQTLLAFTTAEACMTSDPMTVEPGTPAAQAALVLKTYKFGALPVVHEGRLVGIVTVSDILDSYISLLSAQEKEVRP
jgi:acetoin utilization protein AcuB